MKISLIAAVDAEGSIGKGGIRPWDFPEDLAHFRQTVSGSPVIVGRTTYEKDAKKVFPNSPTIILSRKRGYKVDGAIICQSLSEALSCCRQQGDTQVYVAGGEDVYTTAISQAGELIITYLPIRIGGDRHFPKIDEQMWQVERSQKHANGMRIVWYKRKQERKLI